MVSRLANCLVDPVLYPETSLESQNSYECTGKQAGRFTRTLVGLVAVQCRLCSKHYVASHIRAHILEVPRGERLGRWGGGGVLLESAPAPHFEFPFEFCAAGLIPVAVPSVRNSVFLFHRS